MQPTNWRLLASTLVLSLALSAPHALAQSGSPKNEKSDVPKEYRPPAGMCRVWMDGVPAAQQPAPTDCAAAVRNKPANGRVVYGEDAAKKKSDLPIKGFAKPSDKKGAPLIPPDQLGALSVSKGFDQVGVPKCWSSDNAAHGTAARDNAVRGCIG